MITKERLQKLIEEEATIYDYQAKEIKLKKEYNIDSYLNLLNTNTSSDNFIINNIYETKEESEFVIKNHKTRVEKFEPPFKLMNGERWEFVSKEYWSCEIMKSGVNTYVVLYNDTGIAFRTYQEAIDYAIKLFGGE